MAMFEKGQTLYVTEPFLQRVTFLRETESTFFVRETNGRELKLKKKAQTYNGNLYQTFEEARLAEIKDTRRLLNASLKQAETQVRRLERLTEITEADIP